MILVLARAGDDVALRLVAGRPAGDVRHVTPQDVMRPGWSLALGAAAGATFAVGGEVFDAASVRGIVNLLSYIGPAESVGLHADDRAYAAVETQSFLIAWLHRLRAPKLNPPSFRALNGDPGHPLIWRDHARRAGLRTVCPHADQPRISVTVVGERVLGTDDRTVASAALGLSRAARLPLVGIEFVDDGAGIAFSGATCTPQLEAAWPALDEYFLEASA